MLTYAIIKEAKEKELYIMQGTLHNSEYNKNRSSRKPNQQKHNKKWTTFTYSGTETKKISKLFKETQL
jgi:hypothetical protein